VKKRKAPHWAGLRNQRLAEPLGETNVSTKNRRYNTKAPGFQEGAPQDAQETAADWGFDVPDAAAWPRPTELTKTSEEEGGDTLTLPLALLPKPLSSYAATTAKCMGTLSDAIVIPALCAAGALLGREVKIQVKQNETGWTEGPAMWGNVIAPPGSLKSPATARALKPIVKLQSELDAAWRHRCAATVEANKNRARGAEREPMPSAETVLFHDGTGELRKLGCSPGRPLQCERPRSGSGSVGRMRRAGRAPEHVPTI
jgi:hypothetical protein